MELRISLQAMEAMRIHAEKDYPNECCGFIFGSDDGQRKVEIIREVPNNQEGDQSKRFEVSPLDYMKAEKFALDSNLTLLGIYHSHPDHPAIPSRHDHKQAVPFFSYIILSVRNGKVARSTSWQLKDGKFRQENISEETEYLLKN